MFLHIPRAHDQRQICIYGFMSNAGHQTVFLGPWFWKKIQNARNFQNTKDSFSCTVEPTQRQNVIQLVTFWRVNFCFRRGWGSWKKTNQEMPFACLWFNFLRTTFWVSISRRSKYSKEVYQKPGQNVIHVFCEKEIWRVKWQNVWRIFLEWSFK